MICKLFIVAAVLELIGFSSPDLKVHSSFDNNNVNLGDPLKYRLVFKGTGDFSLLGSPAIERTVSAKLWKIDSFGVKSDTYGNAKVFEYTVRPQKSGLSYFPSISFSFSDGSGGTLTVATQSIPVHVREGEQVVLLGSEELSDEMPMPDALFATASVQLSGDDEFLWRKALRTLDPELFARFDFVEAKMNEAGCRVLKGEWAKALALYHSLEWRVGQTESIERGIVSCLARRYGNKNAQLPAWREILRPVLKYGWKVRLGIAVSTVGGLVLLFLAFARVIKIAALVMVTLFVPMQANAFDSIFNSIRRNSSFFNSMFEPSGGVDVQTLSSQIKIAVVPPEKTPVVGEEFAFRLEIEIPKSASIGNLALAFDKTYALKCPLRSENLEDAEVAGGTNTVKRILVYARYDAPMDTSLTASLSGFIKLVRRVERQGFNSVFSTQGDFTVKARPFPMKVQALNEKEQPADFGGVVGISPVFERTVSVRRVMTNDVVAVNTLFSIEGFIPDEMCNGVFEKTENSLKAKTYFVADGRTKIPQESISYYNVDTKKYEKCVAPEITLEYVGKEVSSSAGTSRAVDMTNLKGMKLIKLRFAPFDEAQVIGMDTFGAGKPEISDCCGEWIRVKSSSSLIGWVRMSELGLKGNDL